MAMYDNPDHRATGTWIDRAAVDGRDLLLLAARVLMAAIFIQSGFGKLLNIGDFAGNLAGQGVPFAPAMAAVGAGVEFFGGVALLLGAWTRVVAVLLAGFTVAATLIAHRFWEAPEAARTMQTIQFMKNVAIIGGFLGIVAGGGGRFGVDGFWHRRS